MYLYFKFCKSKILFTKYFSNIYTMQIYRAKYPKLGFSVIQHQTLVDASNCTQPYNEPSTTDVGTQHTAQVQQ